MYNILYNVDSDIKRLVTTNHVDLGTKEINGHKHMTMSFVTDGITHTLIDVKDCSDADLSALQSSVVKLLCSGSVMDLTTNNWTDRTPGDLPGNVLDDGPVQTRIDKDFWSRTCNYYNTLSGTTKSKISSQFSTIAHYLESGDYDSLTYIGKDKVLTVFLFNNYYFSTDKAIALRDKWKERFNSLPMDAQEYLRKFYPPFVYGIEKDQPPLCDDEVLDIIDQLLNHYLS